MSLSCVPSPEICGIVNRAPNPWATHPPRSRANLIPALKSFMSRGPGPDARRDVSKLSGPLLDGCEVPRPSQHEIYGRESLLPIDDVEHLEARMSGFLGNDDRAEELFLVGEVPVQRGLEYLFFDVLLELIPVSRSPNVPALEEMIDGSGRTSSSQSRRSGTANATATSHGARRRAGRRVPRGAPEASRP